jgi:4-amino-4-deoxy-L-arabinose transferase-like glycosyltransferase
MTRTWNGKLLLGIFLLAAVLRLAVAARSDLWADEIFSLAMATGHSLEHPAAAARPELGDFVEPDNPVPAGEFRRYLKHDSQPASPFRVIRAVSLSDTSPPLYYLLLYGWTLLAGTSDLGLRSLSIVCSLACLPLVAGIARRIGDEGAVLPACILFSFSPLCVYYSTEGRMYSLLWLFVLGTVWASLLLRDRGRNVRLEVAWIGFSAAGFLTHYFFVFPWVGLVAMLAICPGSFQRVRLAGCTVATGLLISPWYIQIPESLRRWRVTADWLKWRPSHFDRLSAFRELVLQFFGSSGHRMAFVVLTLFALSFAFMFWRLRRRSFTGDRVFVWVVFAAACAGPMVFDFVQRTYTVAVPRYAIAALPAAFLLAGLALSTFHPAMRGVLLLLIVTAWTTGLLNIYRDRTPWSPMRKLGIAASAESGPLDLILVHSIPSGVLGIARYETGPADLASWVGQLGNRRTPDSLLQLAAGRTRIRFVEVHAVGEPAAEEEWLRAHAIVTHEAQFGSGRLVDFRPLNSGTF